MIRRPYSLVLLVPLLLAACNDELAPTAREDEVVPMFSAAGGGRTLDVLSYNLYVGADLDQVMGALLTPDHGDDFPAILGGITTMQTTDFPARAEALADAIAAARPHAVGLQEVWSVAIDLRPYGVPINFNNDFLPILQDALARRGVNYLVAGKVTNTDASPLPGIRVVDHDVLLVDPTRVEVSNVVARNFQANIGPVAPGLTLLRGYVMADATIDGETVRIVNTHFESGKSAQIIGLRAYQAQEIAAITASAPRVIVLGDLNDQEGSPMYQVLASAGMHDAWSSLRPGATGLTCCHAPDLSDERGAFDQRIDFVLARGFDEPGRVLKGVIDILDDQPKAQLDGPAHRIWPSDHAGLSARIRID